MLSVFGALSEQPECRRACTSSILRFAQSKPAGFVVGTNLALKRLTYFLPDVHAALRSSTTTGRPLYDAVRLPMLIDVGAAAYGGPYDADGSDSQLLAIRFAQARQSVSIHAFEMQKDMATRLRKEAKKLNLGRLANYTVHTLGVGARPAQLPVMSPNGKKRTVGLVDVNVSRYSVPQHARQHGKSRRTHVDRMTLSSLVTVTTLDAFAARFDRRIFYLKIDTEGHEPQVLQGMHVLLRERPPLFISFEYSGGWSTQLRKLAELKASQPAGGTARWGRSALGTDSSSLRDVSFQLAQHNYAVFLLHQEGLVRIDGPWWDDFFELVLLRDSQVPAWHDLIAAQRGPPLRALLATFNERPLPCMPNQRLPACTAAPPLAMTLGASCRCFSVGGGVRGARGH